MPRSISVLLLALLVSALAACGGDGNDDESGETTSADTGGGLTVEIDPTSGPPGTPIQWSVSGCEADDETSVSIYDQPLEEYQAGTKSKPLTKTIRGPEDSGALTVPDDVPPGDYTFTAGCTSTGKGAEPGVFTIGVRGTETAFEVTG